MKTTDIFNINSKKLNEAVEKTFGQKLKLETFELDQLQDVRNKLRTHIHQFKQHSNFNETLDNDAYTKAQWMLDTVNAEIAEREHVIESETESENLPENTQGEDMTGQVRESATDKASAVVTAKTMVDRVGRWIEELAGMENDTLLTLGDTIRDEMGQDQAKTFLSAVAPAIQQALENLKTTRETLASGVRSLTGEAQPAELIGAEPTDAGVEPVEPDAMNDAPEGFGDEEEPAAPEDDFAAAEPAAGGSEEAGRMKRESIERQNKLLKVLAG
jgi:hypothetical protein